MPEAEFAPMEMLLACHEKVRRFSALMIKLAKHVEQKGADQQAHDAAQAVLRYFDIAAPLHHDDEDLNLYPALCNLGDETLRSNIAQLQQEHDELNTLWGLTRPWLMSLSRAPWQRTEAPPSLYALGERYPAHADREEALVYPHAAQLHELELATIGQAMISRRRT